MDPDRRYALLIGFIYPNSYQRLPGSLVDLYRVYSFLRKKGFSEIDLITDLDTDPETFDYRQPIIEGYVDANMLSFISEMKKTKKHHLVRNNEDLSNIILSLLKGKDRLFIYMTGHGEERGFVCPVGILSWPDLQSSIFTPLRKKSQAIMILDACHAWHFQLPYFLSRDKNRLSFVGTTFFPVCHLVLFATQGREAAATTSCSLVTRSLINLLEKGYDQYFFLRQKVEEDLKSTETLRSMQLQVGVYTSYPSLYRIWPWFWGKEKTIYAYDNDLFVELRR
jgi:hypothetical protein